MIRCRTCCLRRYTVEQHEPGGLVRFWGGGGVECGGPGANDGCSVDRGLYSIVYNEIAEEVASQVPELTRRDRSLEVKRRFRDRHYEPDMKYRARELSGKTEYEGPEFTVNDDGEIYYPTAGRTLNELFERQKQYRPESYSPAEHQTALLVQREIVRGTESGTSEVSHISYFRSGEGEERIRDVFTLSWDGRKGRTRVTNIAPDGNHHTVREAQTVMRSMFSGYREVNPQPEIFVFARIADFPKAQPDTVRKTTELSAGYISTRIVAGTKADQEQPQPVKTAADPENENIRSDTYGIRDTDGISHIPTLGRSEPADSKPEQILKQPEVIRDNRPDISIAANTDAGGQVRFVSVWETVFPYLTVAGGKPDTDTGQRPAETMKEISNTDRPNPDGTGLPEYVSAEGDIIPGAGDALMTSIMVKLATFVPESPVSILIIRHMSAGQTDNGEIRNPNPETGGRPDDQVAEILGPELPDPAIRIAESPAQTEPELYPAENTAGQLLIVAMEINTGSAGIPEELVGSVLSESTQPDTDETEPKPVAGFSGGEGRTLIHMSENPDALRESGSLRVDVMLETVNNLVLAYFEKKNGESNDPVAGRQIHEPDHDHQYLAGGDNPAYQIADRLTGLPEKESLIWLGILIAAEGMVGDGDSGSGIYIEFPTTGIARDETIISEPGPSSLLMTDAGEQQLQTEVKTELLSVMFGLFVTMLLKRPDGGDNPVSTGQQGGSDMGQRKVYPVTAAAEADLGETPGVWLILSIIWHLTMLREGGFGMSGANQNPSGTVLLPAAGPAQLPVSGDVFPGIMPELFTGN